MMSTKHRWLALVVALSLLVGALAPATAFAARGGRPIDSPGEPIDPPLEYGDPDPGGGAPQQVWTDFTTWKQILLISMQIRFGVPSMVTRSTQAAAPVGPVRMNRGIGK